MGNNDNLPENENQPRIEDLLYTAGQNRKTFLMVRENEQSLPNTDFNVISKDVINKVDGILATKIIYKADNFEGIASQINKEDISGGFISESVQIELINMAQKEDKISNDLISDLAKYSNFDSAQNLLFSFGQSSKQNFKLVFNLLCNPNLNYHILEKIIVFVEKLSIGNQVFAKLTQKTLENLFEVLNEEPYSRNNAECQRAIFDFYVKQKDLDLNNNLCYKIALNTKNRVVQKYIYLIIKNYSIKNTKFINNLHFNLRKNQNLVINKDKGDDISDEYSMAA